MQTMRKYSTTSGVPVRVVDFDKVASLGFGYPPMGKYSSKLHDRIEREAGKGTITIVIGGSYISLRISKSISGMVSILERIEELKGLESLSITGGGHNEAASIKCEPSQMDDVVESLLAALSVRPSP
jgi:RecJ-like exonuclease